MRSPAEVLEHLYAHLPQRIEHAAHRALRQRRVADEGGFHVISANKPHGEPRTGSSITEIESSDRLEERAIAGAVDDPFLAALFYMRAHCPHGFAGPHNVLALQQAGDAGLAGCQPAKHERAMRDRFVARHARRALKAQATCGRSPAADCWHATCVKPRADEFGRRTRPGIPGGLLT